VPVEPAPLTPSVKWKELQEMSEEHFDEEFRRAFEEIGELRKTVAAPCEYCRVAGPDCRCYGRAR
jgi:hypothetical protein